MIKIFSINHLDSKEEPIELTSKIKEEIKSYLNFKSLGYLNGFCEDVFYRDYHRNLTFDFERKLFEEIKQRKSKFYHFTPFELDGKIDFCGMFYHSADYQNFNYCFSYVSKFPKGLSQTGFFISFVETNRHD